MTRLATLDDLRATCNVRPAGDDDAAQAATARQAVLTKPPGSLGRLEETSILMARWQGREKPALDRVHVLIFAGSHGVTARGVSAFPAEVTAQMVANFSAGGAAINQLAKQAGASLTVTPLEIERPTADFTQAPAMDEADFLKAVQTGFDAVPEGADLISLGEMGIGNTTAAAALAAALFGGRGADWVGRGTGVDDAGLSRKAEAVDAALACHGEALSDPLEALRRVGGRELAAMFGAALSARQKRIPLLLDGFVCGAAVAPLARLGEDGLAHAIAGHVSAEPGHRKLLAELGLRPLLDLDMRLGEGSGACLAINILRGALACHNGMATFAEAGVSDG
ncbi:nicotinate-nucleotide--dimethylbenzimidazole phosphoribosyltransferase (plasmid) [Nitratireductor rhodophyticola]|uniref:nicotinate-nucleotide--dimethylbenzimidazole phosphoribosyltransferase n=1 Tax=Nitratireductor rhodophyticola TaxID=2854036 RepID=UPI002AC9E8DE|nr:nicotinate-nucleotide--dimethylbenzimidazole phosphoribosyltransferase [Nitratireductor rhodophyticola]WPZ16761.1 nicotinate-nucleotide--dimethylbenzimidazole phosphoribosyltransferase [Nitratireductor rhodophyticola]